MKIQWDFDDVVTDFDKSILEDVLPPDRSYKVEKLKISEEQVSNLTLETAFETTVHLNICEIDDAHKFLEELYHASSSTYNIKFHSDRVNGKRYLLSGDRKCQHNVKKIFNKKTNQLKKDQCKGKNTKCPASLKFQLKQKVEGHQHGDECDLFNFKFTLKHTHNHRLASSTALKFHPVSRDTKRKYLELFNKDLSASESYHKYKDYLVEQYGPDECVKLGADRSIDPDYQWVFREHSKYLLSKYGRMNSPESFQLTAERVANYNENHGRKLAEFRQRPDGNYIVVLLDPLILRVHEVNISYFISLEMFSHIHSLPCHKWSITIHHVQCTPLPHLLEMF